MVAPLDIISEIIQTYN
jgi:hypothetical protein